MNKSDDTALLLGQLIRIADALERKHPIDMTPDALPKADAYVWQSDVRQLIPVAKVNRLDIGLLKGINEQRDDLLSNTLGLFRVFRRITRFYGARVALVNHLWLRRSMAQ